MSRLISILFQAAAVFLPVFSASADDWPQWLGPHRDAVWRETGVLKPLPTKGLKIRWRTPVGGGYSGPSVAEGKVYLSDRQLAPKSANPADPFQRGIIAGTERVLCLNEADGKVLWKHEYDCPYNVSYPAGPRASPIIEQGKFYTLGTEGNLFCLDARKGNVLWSHELKKDFGIDTPVWGFAG